jgi:hypothetical protein
MRRRPFLILLFCLGLVFPRPVVAGAQFAPLLDLRVRQEILDGVYHFAPDPDRNWLRVRTRAGGRADLGRHRLELRLNNEHRHYLHPDQPFSWDEVILDRGFWRWNFRDESKFTVGRQDIMWPGGFLVLDGHPYDGSRSAYHNALRLELGGKERGLDVAVIRNPKYDPIVLIDDQHRRLTDADETGAYLRLRNAAWQGSIIWKREKDPDLVLENLTTLTVGGRFDGEVGAGHRLEAELAYQFQNFSEENCGCVLADGDHGGAWAGQAFLTREFPGDWRAELGAFYYGGGRHAFRAPWGRWPKWSELYIYTLIGESTPGRVTVAAWENIAAPRLTVRHGLHERLDLRLGASWLAAPEPAWLARGVLTQTELETDLGTGFSGHLLWEMLVPGPFHDGGNGLPPLTNTVHFLRWQISWSL